MKPQSAQTTITAARQPTWRCAAIPTLSGCRPWCRLPITFRFPPLPRKRGRAAETHQKAACTWFFNVQAAFSDSVHEWGAGCFLCVMWLMRQTMALRQPAPSPVGEDWGEGFSGCLPTFGRAAAQRVDMAAIRHALPLNLLPPFGFAFSQNGNGRRKRFKKQPAPCFLRTIRRA